MKERGNFAGKGVSGLAPFKEPLSVKRRSLRNQKRNILLSAWWLRLLAGHGYS